ncbi:MAG: hypothetical protein K0R39_1756 [Symbiobacteriaceae bacterium]|jgi:hypothetical protein|nr:hypothetical protein [Symbiobacteriaceae bacterium]
MTVRAVDLQTMIPRLNEASRLQQQAELLPQMAQHAQSLAEQARARDAQSRVLAKTNVENARIGREGKGQAGGGGQPGAGKERKDTVPGGSQKPVSEPGRGHKLDVKL